KNYEYPFTTSRTFPSLAEELCQEIAVANNTKKKYTFTFNPTDAVSHRTSIRFVPQSGTLSPGVGINVKVYCTFLCTSHTKDIVDVFAKTEKRGDEGVHAAINIICTTNVSSRIDYEELEKFNTIGDGAYGVVYIGKYRGSVVAIKESKLFSDGDDDESFVKEVDLMDKMRCPYIINFIGASVTPNHFSIATEYAKYGSLKSVYIDPKFTTLLGIKILLDVSKGMDFLHESNIIHRDIKPDNILIVSLNNDENVNAKISDFGNSRALTENSIKDSMTKALGTP
ncbi:protein kinase, putative, partial [Entamoeba invadens IP1]